MRVFHRLVDASRCSGARAMISVLTFLSSLRWIDGLPLKVEPYRRDIFRRALDERRPDGAPRYNMVLAGRAKKNFKSADLVLAGLFSLMCRESPQGSDVLLIGNDESQASADLDLAKRLVGINPDLADELEVLSKEIRRRDGKGTMRVLPAQNAIGQHGRTAQFIGYDEIHGYRDWALMEALQPDPTRTDVLQWITSYDSIFDVEGCPLHDLRQIGVAGSDPRMLFSWYSADFCTDPAFANLPPDERANPSMASWPEGKAYLEQQRRRLPSARFRRLHHNLPGAPAGAYFDQAIIERAIVAGRQVLEPQDGIDYLAFVDMSGGSNDDATLGIAHWTGEKAVLDLLISQADAVPFNPRLAVARFAAVCKRYRCRVVHGDAYAGETFRRDFSDCGIEYQVCKQTRTDLYERLEVALNADQVELLDIGKLRRELLTIVARGATLDHMPGQHDDWATSAAGALTLVNPDMGKATPHILEFYRRQSEAITKGTPAPTLHQQHGTEAVLQVGTRRPAGHVKVIIVNDASHIGGASGFMYPTELDGDRRICWMAADDALIMIASPFADPALRQANAELLELGGRMPRPSRGVRVVDVLQAAEDARPRTPTEMLAAIRGETNAQLRDVGLLR
jgi:hypothetical protein